MEYNGLVIYAVAGGLGGTNCYIVSRKDSDTCVVIDPGFDGSQIAEYIADKGLKVSHIFLTHGHYDHILGVPEMKAATNAKVCALEEERQVLGNAETNLSVNIARTLELEADVWFRDGQKYEAAGMTFEVMHTPGHTEGSCCYYMEEERVLFSGDTLFMESVGRTDLPTGSGQKLLKSLTERVLTLPDGVRVFPGHGEETLIGFEKVNNPFVNM